MDRAVKHFEESLPKCILIRADSGELHNVPIAHIRYIESSGHSFTVHAKGLTLSESRRSLQRLQEELDALSPGLFISPYKGFVVNQSAISSIERDHMTLIEGTRIPVPKREFKALQNQYMDYLFSQNTLKGNM